MPRVTGAKTRQAILYPGATIDPNDPPERLVLFDQFGAPISLGGSVGIPSGGGPTQILAKASAADYDADWVDLVIPPSIPAGGALNQVLAKASAASYDVAWVNPSGAVGAGADVLAPQFSDDFASSPPGTFWTLDPLGAQNLTVSGGQLVPGSVNSEYRLILEGAEYQLGQIAMLLKFTTGPALTNLQVCPMFGYKNAQNFIFADFVGAGSFDIYEKHNNAFTALAGTAQATAINTTYWIRVRWEGSKMILELFTSDPEAPVAPAVVATRNYDFNTVARHTRAGKIGLRLVSDSGAGVRVDFLKAYGALKVPGSSASWPSTPKSRVLDVISSLVPASLWDLREITGAFADTGTPGGVPGTFVSGNRGLGGPGRPGSFGAETLTTSPATGLASFGDFYDFTGNAPFTVLVAHKPMEYGTNARRIFAKEGGVAGSGWMLGYSTDGRPFALRQGGAASINAPDRISLDQWNLIAMTYDGATTKCYCNGRIAGIADAGALVNGAGIIRLGYESANTELYDAPGRFSTPAIWNRALATSELDQILAAF